MSFNYQFDPPVSDSIASLRVRDLDSLANNDTVTTWGTSTVTQNPIYKNDASFPYVDINGGVIDLGTYSIVSSNGFTYTGLVLSTNVSTLYPPIFTYMSARDDGLRLIRSGSGADLYFYSDGPIRAWPGPATVTDVNTWQVFSVRASNNGDNTITMDIFIDNVNMGTNTVPVSDFCDNTSGNIDVGKSSLYSTDPAVPIYISDTFFYDRALTDAELTEMYTYFNTLGDPYVPRYFNQLQIQSSGPFFNMAELQIFDITGTNIALLGTASAIPDNGQASRGIDGNIPTVSTDVGALDMSGNPTWVLDLNRGYSLSEINKVIFHNVLDVPSRATGCVITFHSDDGEGSEQVAVLTADQVQEFVITLPPEFLLPTAGVTSISATVVEVTGAVTYQINVTESLSGTTRVAHTGISTGDFVINSLTPETTYVLQLYANKGSGYVLEDTETVTTLENSAANYDITVYGSNGEFDLSVLDNSSFSLLDEVINDLFTTGDNLEIKLGPNTSDVSFVKVGEVISTEKSILVPFNSSSGSGQVITMTLSDTSNVSVSYNEVNNSITVDGSTLEVGDSIILDGKKMTVILSIFD